MKSQTPIILLIDDDPNDILFLKQALRKAGVHQSLREVHDGEEAIAYLEGRGQYQNRDRYPLPCLMLLDIKMPRVNGLEVLRWLRNKPEFKDLPVCMVTSGDEPRDRNEAQEQGIEAYCVKPVTLTGLVEMARQIREKVEVHCGKSEADSPEKCEGSA